MSPAEIILTTVVVSSLLNLWLFRKYFQKYHEAPMDALTNRLNCLAYCESCGMAGDKDKFAKVKRRTQSWVNSHEYYEGLVYYCEKHTPKWHDLEVENVCPPSLRFYREKVEVDEKGKEVIKEI